MEGASPAEKVGFSWMFSLSGKTRFTEENCTWFSWCFGTSLGTSMERKKVPGNGRVSRTVGDGWQLLDRPRRFRCSLDYSPGGCFTGQLLLSHLKELRYCYSLSLFP